MADVRRLESLTREESMGLLGSVWVGRLVFTRLALPAIWPVKHLVEADRIVIRAERGAAGAPAVGEDGGTVVAYEADVIGLDDQLGWTVIVVGRARSLPNGGEAERYREKLPAWVHGASGDIIVVEADMVDGFRVVRDSSAAAGPA